MSKETTAELSDHTMAVLLSQEVATLTTKLEAADTALEATINAISELQRYEIDADYNCYLEIDEDKEGDWVRFEDVIKLTGADQ